MFIFNRKDFKQDILINEFGGNLERCAKTLNLDFKNLDKILNKNGTVGINTLKKIINHCEKVGLNSKKYIKYDKDSDCL